MVARNRKNAFGFLKTLSEQPAPALGESCILAWAQLGRVVNHDELNLVLIKLLEYLGRNELISAIAFTELVRLAAARKTDPRRLLEPFWKSLAYLATKDLVSHPRMSEVIANLLQISVHQLLLLIQSHALPWLVLEGKTEVIQMIAEARQETDTWRSIVDAPNLSAILAVLLMQQTDDMEAYVMSRLSAISPHFDSLTLTELLKLEPALTAMELLKAAGEADETRKACVSCRLLSCRIFSWRCPMSVGSRLILIRLHCSDPQRAHHHERQDPWRRQGKAQKKGPPNRSLPPASHPQPHGKADRTV